MQGGLLWALIISSSLSIPIFNYFGLYRAIARYAGSAVFYSITSAFILYGLLFFSIFTLIGMDNVPRSIGVIQPLLFFISISSVRFLACYWFGGGSVNKKGRQLDPTVMLIYGAGSAGRQLAAALNVNKEVALKGFIDDDPQLQGNTVNGLWVYSSLDLRSLLKKLSVTDIVLAIPSASQSRRREIIDLLYGCGVRVTTIPNLLDIRLGRISAGDVIDLDMNDLLGRKVVPPNILLLEKNIRNKVVLVTGAGGSIGSELCRQIIKFAPEKLILLDSSEHALYTISEELKRYFGGDNGCNIPVIFDENYPTEVFDGHSIRLSTCLGSVQDKNLIANILAKNKPSTVFHAAAYKHVPLVELNPIEGIKNNVFGTLNCAIASIDAEVSNFILISTDKAVRPANVMGASKRVAELVLQALAQFARLKSSTIKFSMVRFGNVLGSSGSVVPLFSAQIKAGGPITLTHPEVTRFFMTIPEAAQLVIQSSAMTSGGDVFILDMGDPIRIYDLAIKMIYLSGRILRDESTASGDIEIAITGLRSGEKLHEELLIGNNPQPTAHPKIMKAHEEFLSWDNLSIELEKLERALDVRNLDAALNILSRLVPGYVRNEIHGG
ncbi:polysaccharide biosynthesis protein [Polynucleobacter sp. JS-JIR-5-A7]|nr:polysaccharide biosynthesis protein [Polynucleobacter sp. JS-JIR-5-A7]